MTFRYVIGWKLQKLPGRGFRVSRSASFEVGPPCTRDVSARAEVVVFSQTVRAEMKLMDPALDDRLFHRALVADRPGPASFRSDGSGRWRRRSQSACFDVEAT